MRRLASLLAVGLLSLGALTAQADAQMQCLSPAQRAVFDVQALRSRADGAGDRLR